MVLGFSFTKANDYEYTNLDIVANILADGTIDVNENFTANFFEKKHWVVRYIPLNYTIEWQSFHIDVSNVNVQWKKFTTTKNNWNIEIKVWDINKTVIWEQNYPIFYKTYWLIRNFSWMWYAELYRNLVWYDFDTSIGSIQVELNLPEKNSFNSDDFLITVDWKENSVWGFAWKIDWSKWDKIIITYDKKLDMWEWLTLAIKFPVDYFEFDDDKQAALIWDLKNNKFKYKNISSSTKMLIYSFWFLFLFFWIMYISKNCMNKKIKPVSVWNGFKTKYPLVVQYFPPKWINSAEAGLLFNCRVDPVDITSLFYQWINDKLIRVDYNRDASDPKKIKNITFVKVRDIPESCPYYEREFFNGVFRDKRTKFIDENTDLSRVIPLEWLEDFWIHKHRLRRRKNLSFLWIVLSILFVILLILWFYYFKLLGILFLVLFVPLFCGIAYKQNNKIQLTDEWMKIMSHLVWYAKFVKECDENVLKTFLKEDPLYVDKTLPYAVAFWLESEFLNKVTPLLKDIEQSWLNSKDFTSAPVKDFVDFMSDILLKTWGNWRAISYGLYNLYWWWNYNKSFWESVKKPLNYGKKWNYTKLWWFKVWSIFSWWWKLFKKWGGGWWWGSRSW